MNPLSPSNPPTSTPPSATGATKTKHRVQELAEERGQTVKEAIFLIEQVAAMETLLGPLKELHRLRTTMGASQSLIETAGANVEKALGHRHLPPELVPDLRKCGRDVEIQIITVNHWIERHWAKLVRVMDVLVGLPGAVVAIITADLLLRYAQAIDYVQKRGKIVLGEVVIALKSAPAPAVEL